MGTFSSLSRSKIMASIRSKNTKPELAVRSALHRMGFRFRLHCSEMPGKPDIVLPKYRAIVWVHGCFWHSHSNCRTGRRPKSNIDYWHPKIARNIERDKINRRKNATVRAGGIFCNLGVSNTSILADLKRNSDRCESNCAVKRNCIEALAVMPVFHCVKTALLTSF